MIFYTVLRHTNIALYFIAIEYGSNHTHKCVVDVFPYIPTYPSMFFVFFIVLFLFFFFRLCFDLFWFNIHFFRPSFRRIRNSPPNPLFKYAALIALNSSSRDVVYGRPMVTSSLREK